MTRGDLTDEQWSLIEPHLPLGERISVPDLRQQFDAVLWRFRTSAPWEDLPAEYGPWPMAYDRYRWWAAAGVFAELAHALLPETTDIKTSHTSPAGAILGGELARALKVAADEEKGLQQLGSFPAIIGQTRSTGTTADGYDATGSG
ncbi:transposase [Nonomuraea sp. NPDC048826]|uniref:transposase n=1 Tax=Nonomuraea sp. NPDC048826 TaxID=3364347 RepID=UPI003712AEEC